MSEHAAVSVEAVLTELARQYELHNDPGVSDLYNNQPFPIHMPLGMLRGARNLLAAYLVSVNAYDDLVAALRPFAELADIFASTGASTIGGPDMGKALAAARAALSRAEQPE